MARRRHLLLSRGLLVVSLGLLVIVGGLVTCLNSSPQPQAAGRPPVEEGAVTLLIQPEAGRKPLLAALEGATCSIYLAVYLLTDPEIIQALRAAAARGVAVWVMLEEAPYGAEEGNRAAAAALEEAGVHFRWSSPAFNYLHQKSIVVDEEVAFILTHNLTRSAFSRNREYGVVTRNATHLGEILRVFQADWQREGCDLSQSVLYWAPDNSRDRLLQLIDQAQSRMDLQQSAMQDEEIISHLAAAARRGVQVRYLSTPSLPLADDVNEPGREQLRRAEVKVRYLSDPYIHAKAFVVDGRLGFVGSQNMTANSLDFNRELGIAFTDAEAVRLLASQFTLDWRASAMVDARRATGFELQSRHLSFILRTLPATA